MKHHTLENGDEGREVAAHPAWFAWSGIAVFFLVYLIVFALTRGGDFSANIWRASYNTLPVIPLVFSAHALLVSQVWTRRIAFAAALQLPMALAFAFAWYLGIIVLKDLPSNWVQSGFEVRPFVPIALVWQLFQGMTLYAVVALGSLAIHLAQRLSSAKTVSPSAQSDAPQALLLKTGNEHEAIDYAEITRISGAGDYSEVHVRERAILSTTSLAEFESRLPETDFIRAHRSHLVRIGAIVRAEPAGNGRTTLHLSDGSLVVSSRSGTRTLRDIAA